MNKLPPVLLVFAVILQTAPDTNGQSAGRRSRSNAQQGSQPTTSITVNQNQQQRASVRANESGLSATNGNRRGTGPGGRDQRNQQAGNSQPNNRQGRNGRRDSSGRDPRQFTNNAMLFDGDGDQQLAAHELRNMFVVLVSQQQQQQISIRGNNPAGSNTSPQPFASNVNQVGSQAGSAGLSGGAPIAQGTAIRQAILIFLQLVMQFDANGDGLLSQAELLQFANALSQYDMNLLAAAGSRAAGPTGTGVANMGGQRLSPTSRQQPAQSRVRSSQQQQQSVSVVVNRSGRQRTGSGDRGPNGPRGGSQRGGRQGTNAQRLGRPATDRSVVKRFAGGRVTSA